MKAANACEACDAPATATVTKAGVDIEVRVCRVHINRYVTAKMIELGVVVTLDEGRDRICPTCRRAVGTEGRAAHRCVDRETGHLGRLHHVVSERSA